MYTPDFSLEKHPSFKFLVICFQKIEKVSPHLFDKVTIFIYLRVFVFFKRGRKKRRKRTNGKSNLVDCGDKFVPHFSFKEWNSPRFGFSKLLFLKRVFAAKRPDPILYH